MYGWMGKILQVNLSNSEVKTISTQPYAEKFLGGRGIASRLYWETVSPEVKAFDPENRLIFMTGPIVATGAQAANRMSVVGKSPMTLPEGYCCGNIGGFFPAELKKAGFDGVIITGQAPKPVYLWIHNNEAELRDASSLWGQGAYRTGEMLQQAHDEKIRFLTTGVAGENRVRTAVVFGSHEGASSAGYGAVMGAKNLKAIAVRGTGKPSVADPDKLKELNRYIIKISKRLRFSIPPVVEATKHDQFVEVIGKGGCYQCGLECVRGQYRYGQRLEGYRKCQSMEYYLPRKYSREDEPVETFFDAPALANDYSICTWELQKISDWLYDCYQSGDLTEKETGLPLSRIGTREFLEKLLQSITYREGFGDILAEGLVRAGEKLSGKARARFGYNFTPIGLGDLFPPRAYIVHALLYPMEPRVNHNILHETAWVNIAWFFNQIQSDRYTNPVTAKVVRDIARAFWGSEEAGDFTSYEGKALAAKKIQDGTYNRDSLGMCDFAYPITYSFNTPDHVGDPDLEAKIFTAVTGIAGEELDRYGERIFNLQRAILLREGRRVPEADFPPEYNFTEPLPAGAHLGGMAVLGPGGKVVNPVGTVLDRDRFTSMLKEYYHLRGWDKETGLPKPETLAALGLDDLVSAFQSFS